MITASIVLYKENLEVLKKTVDSFLHITPETHLYLVDNSPINTLEKHFKQENITYMFNNKNIGFAKAHNLVLNKINSQFHLILNPDVVFNPDVIPKLMQRLRAEEKVSFITPKVVYPNEELQYVCRRFPTILDLINRRITFSRKLLFKNEYLNQNLNNAFYPDFIHGCFMFFKTKDLKQLQGFDERYFLYMEDVDLCKKVKKFKKKILYFPDVSIVHQHQQGSSKSLKLFLYHISSAIKYFLKWGFR